VFNCGIGFIVVVAAKDAGAVRDRLDAFGEKTYVIGAVERRAPGGPGTIVE
jgi:phosphoribosylformylglycinamidine cyclo-ligase